MDSRDATVSIQYWIEPYRGATPRDVRGCLDLRVEEVVRFDEVED